MKRRCRAFLAALSVLAGAILFVDSLVTAEPASAHAQTYEYFNHRMGTTNGCSEIFGQVGEGDIAYRYHEDTYQTLFYSGTEVQKYIGGCYGSDTYGIYLAPGSLYNNQWAKQSPDWEEGAVKPCWEVPGYGGAGPDLRYTQPTDGYTMGYGWLVEFTGPCGGFSTDDYDLSGGDWNDNWELTDWKILYQGHWYSGFALQPEQYPNQAGQTAWGKHRFYRSDYLELCQYLCNASGVQQTPPYATQREVKGCGLVCYQQ